VIRVLVADDQAAVRDGFAALIDAQENMLAAGTAANGREAVEKARRTFPHVILMDIRMPVLDGLEATRLICTDPTLERTRVLILTTSTPRSDPAPAASCSKTLHGANCSTQSR